jgi:hypothetical protein
MGRDGRLTGPFTFVAARSVIGRDTDEAEILRLRLNEVATTIGCNAPPHRRLTSFPH